MRLCNDLYIITGASMRAITYTEARNNLASELDRVNNDYDVTIITRQKAEAGVLMSLKEYESLMETAHLLRHPKNAMRLMKAIEDIEARRHIVRRELIEE
jgi:antitoxin YefM